MASGESQQEEEFKGQRAIEYKGLLPMISDSIRIPKAHSQQVLPPGCGKRVGTGTPSIDRGPRTEAQAQAEAKAQEEASNAFKAQCAQAEASARAQPTGRAREDNTEQQQQSSAGMTFAPSAFFVHIAERFGFDFDGSNDSCAISRKNF